jgi:hypothetical protein
MSQYDINQINNLQNQIAQLTKVNNLNQSTQLNRFNSFIQQASDAIMCNSECQRKRTSETLKQKLIDSKMNLASAPNQLDVSEKNYVVFTEGTPAYNELLDQRFTERATVITDKFQENFNSESSVINTQIDTYSVLLINFKNVVDLFLKYKQENKDLFKQLKTERSDILTNERKTFYEDQQIDTLKFYYFYFLLTIYIITVLCFIIFLFIYPSQSSFMVKTATFIGLIILPFFSTYILGFIISIIYKIYNIIPKNVYR